MEGNSRALGEGGFLVIRKPWPSMIRTIWGDDERFKIPGLYCVITVVVSPSSGTLLAWPETPYKR